MLKLGFLSITGCSFWNIFFPPRGGLGPKGCVGRTLMFIWCQVRFCLFICVYKMYKRMHFWRYGAERIQFIGGRIISKSTLTFSVMVKLSGLDHHNFHKRWELIGFLFLFLRLFPIFSVPHIHPWTVAIRPTLPRLNPPYHLSQ